VVVRGGLTTPHGEPVTVLSPFVALCSSQAFIADVSCDGIRGKLAENGVKVGPVKDGGEVESHAHAEGESGGYKCHAQG
jgi:hypothetical protein